MNFKTFSHVSTFNAKYYLLRYKPSEIFETIYIVGRWKVKKKNISSSEETRLPRLLPT